MSRLPSLSSMPFRRTGSSVPPATPTAVGPNRVSLPPKPTGGSPGAAAYPNPPATAESFTVPHPAPEQIPAWFKNVAAKNPQMLSRMGLEAGKTYNNWSEMQQAMQAHQRSYNAAEQAKDQAFMASPAGQRYGGAGNPALPAGDPGTRVTAFNPVAHGQSQQHLRAQAAAGDILNPPSAPPATPQPVAAATSKPAPTPTQQPEPPLEKPLDLAGKADRFAPQSQLDQFWHRPENAVGAGPSSLATSLPQIEPNPLAVNRPPLHEATPPPQQQLSRLKQEVINPQLQGIAQQLGGTGVPSFLRNPDEWGRTTALLEHARQYMPEQHAQLGPQFAEAIQQWGTPGNQRTPNYFGEPPVPTVPPAAAPASPYSYPEPFGGRLADRDLYREIPPAGEYSELAMPGIKSSSRDPFAKIAADFGLADEDAEFLRAALIDWEPELEVELVKTAAGPVLPAAQPIHPLAAKLPEMKSPLAADPAGSAARLSPPAKPNFGTWQTYKNMMGGAGGTIAGNLGVMGGRVYQGGARAGRLVSRLMGKDLAPADADVAGADAFTNYMQQARSAAREQMLNPAQSTAFNEFGLGSAAALHQMGHPTAAAVSGGLHSAGTDLMATAPLAAAGKLVGGAGAVSRLGRVGQGAGNWVGGTMQTIPEASAMGEGAWGATVPGELARMNQEPSAPPAVPPAPQSAPQPAAPAAGQAPTPSLAPAAPQPTAPQPTAPPAGEQPAGKQPTAQPAASSPEQQAHLAKTYQAGQAAEQQLQKADMTTPEGQQLMITAMHGKFAEKTIRTNGQFDPAEDIKRIMADGRVSPEEYQEVMKQPGFMELAKDYGNKAMSIYSAMKPEQQLFIKWGFGLGAAGLLSAFFGQHGLGALLGMLGLGSAGIGAAGAGLFGQGAQDLYNQGGQGLHGMLGGLDGLFEQNEPAVPPVQGGGQSGSAQPGGHPDDAMLGNQLEQTYPEQPGATYAIPPTGGNLGSLPEDAAITGTQPTIDSGRAPSAAQHVAATTSSATQAMPPAAKPDVMQHPALQPYIRMGKDPRVLEPDDAKAFVKNWVTHPDQDAAMQEVVGQMTPAQREQMRAGIVDPDPQTGEDPWPQRPLVGGYFYPKRRQQLLQLLQRG
jgi:hypothetical protein